jgi:hypothetical protein
MSKVGKVLLVLTGLSIIIGGLANFLVQDNPYVRIPFAVALVFFIIEVALDFKIYKEFFTLKTTKHGMNMGIMIILVFILVIAVNFVAVKKNKKWDVTSEKLNSVSEQTIKIVKSLEQDLKI